MQKRNESKLQTWRLLIEEHKQSGLTLTEYCKQKDITLSRYYYYNDLINNPEKVSLQRERKNKAKVKMQPTFPSRICVSN